MPEPTFEEFICLIKELGLPTPGCKMKTAFAILGGKWNMHLLFELSKHPSLRFGELKKAIPEITNTMLTSSLRGLEEKNIISRTQYNEIPPHVEYALTESGSALMAVFYEIFKWSAKYI